MLFAFGHMISALAVANVAMAIFPKPPADLEAQIKELEFRIENYNPEISSELATDFARNDSEQIRSQVLRKFTPTENHLTSLRGLTEYDRLARLYNDRVVKAANGKRILLSRLPTSRKGIAEATLRDFLEKERMTHNDDAANEAIASVKWSNLPFARVTKSKSKI
jgi:hypothetical protein